MRLELALMSGFTRTFKTCSQCLITAQVSKFSAFLTPIAVLTIAYQTANQEYISRYAFFVFKAGVINIQMIIRNTDV